MNVFATIETPAFDALVAKYSATRPFTSSPNAAEEEKVTLTLLGSVLTEGRVIDSKGGRVKGTLLMQVCCAWGPWYLFGAP
jgi:hypothetical protein